VAAESEPVEGIEADLEGANAAALPAMSAQTMALENFIVRYEKRKGC